MTDDRNTDWNIPSPPQQPQMPQQPVTPPVPDTDSYTPGGTAPQYQNAPQPAAPPPPPASPQQPYYVQPPVPPQQSYPPYQQPVYVTPPVYSQTPSKPGSGLAAASLVLGILSIAVCCACCISMVMAIVGLILGIVAKRKGNGGMSTAGIILNIFGLLLAIVMMCFAIMLINDPEWMNEFFGDFYYYNEFYDEFYDDYYSYGEGGQHLTALFSRFLFR